jgi:hypothetical protein
LQATWRLSVPSPAKTRAKSSANRAPGPAAKSPVIAPSAVYSVSVAATSRTSASQL